MKLLLIEDDEDFAEILQSQLENAGFLVDLCRNGSDGLFFLKQQSYQLILLDWMLPILDGLEFLKIIRRQDNSTPVIFITGLSDLSQKLAGLNSGADDYLVKPFAFEELLARIHCILRRPAALKPQKPLIVGDLCYSSSQKELSCQGRSCILTVRESSLLEIFLAHPGKLLPREYLFSEIWGNASEVEDGNLDNYIYFLRNRLNSLKSRSSIKTIRGVGYQLLTEANHDV